MKFEKNMLRKYFVMGSQNCNRDPAQILQEACQAGITAFQYREKGPGSLTGEAKLTLGQKLRKICSENDVLFLVNNDIELIAPLQADGIHVGQQDERTEAIRSQYPGILIGLSVSNMAEVKRDAIAYADYLGAGPVYRTTTKLDAKEPVGTAWIRDLRTHLPDMPFVGIGGITPANAASVLQAGADGVAVVSAISKANDIQTVVANL